jgi:cobalt-zinc-cadmium efflux system membrane fusion protein
VYTADRPELFKITKVGTREVPTTLTANGVVAPDVNRTIHVTSLGSGRVADLKVRLGEQVRKGQVLLVISSPDLAGAFSDYQKAVADERLAKRALDRAKLLLDKGAIAEKDYQVAEDTEEKAKVDVETTAQHVRVLGGDPAHPSAFIELRAPV